MQREREWVRRRYITEGLQGKTGKVRSMLEDEGTLLMVREFIASSQQPGQRMLICSTLTNSRHNN
jgi:hypothetical protein